MSGNMSLIVAILNSTIQWTLPIAIQLQENIFRAILTKNYLSETRLIQKDEVVPFYDELQAPNRITPDDDCHMLIMLLGLQEIVSSI